MLLHCQISEGFESFVPSMTKALRGMASVARLWSEGCCCVER